MEAEQAIAGEAAVAFEAQSQVVGQIGEGATKPGMKWPCSRMLSSRSAICGGV